VRELSELEGKGALTDDSWKQGTRLRSLFCNILSCNVLKIDSRTWSIAKIMHWTREIPEKIKALKLERRKVARNLIPKAMQLTHLFNHNPKRAYDLMFRSNQQRMTHVEYKGTTFEGAEAVEKIREVVAETFSHRADEPCNANKTPWFQDLYIQS
jgi:hypothetical protein